MPFEMQAEGSGNRPSKHVHKDIAQVARGLAEATYEGLMGSSNELWRAWKARHPGDSEPSLRARFVSRYWPAHVDAARATLARILATSTDTKLQEAAYDALCLDATLIRGRGRKPH